MNGCDFVSLDVIKSTKLHCSQDNFEGFKIH